MFPKVILVDKKDNFVGYALVEKAHKGQGKHHRAFVTALVDLKGRVLLQRRKHKLFNGQWDLTAISHPLRLNGKGESYQEASDRALAKEMGIGHVRVKKVGAFNYFAKDGANCENEYCAVLVGKFDGEYEPNRGEVYESKQVRFEDFVRDQKQDPKKYTPWAKLAAKILANYFQNGYH
ncbi:NUDIX domain-containing protein [Candidatus Curtissbacteria bacterium]|nr:NUDIX domain-containing protein [Candidatus Curtissbacteria bacterium]